MQASLDTQIQVFNLVSGNLTPQIGGQARELCLEAYRQQRAAHHYIILTAQRTHLPHYEQANKSVDRSRNHLLQAAGHFGAGRMLQGLEILQAAIDQTRLALTLLD